MSLNINGSKGKAKAAAQKPGTFKETFKQSLWQYFNPAVNAALGKVHNWVLDSRYEKFVLGIMHLENMASILFSYGEEISVSKTAGLQKVIKEALGKDCQVIRASIDDFLYVCPCIDENTYLKNQEDLVEIIRDYGSSLPGTPIYFALKAGATVFTRDSPIETSLDQAFIALYECRNNDTSSHCLFSKIASRMLEYKEQMKMAAFFQSVINNNKLQLVFQPIISSKTGKVKSYEALLRIIDEDGRLITAGPYIPIAEKYGYINKLDHIVLNVVVKELQASPDVQLGMNISNLTIDDKTWLSHARSLLKDVAVAKRLIIEITETGAQRQMKNLIEFVENIQGLGCQVAIDDFGAGYTSFTQLKMLNVDILKIDGMFIRDIHTNPDSQLFVKTLLEFSRAFGLKTVAEFVENGEIAKVLMELGVDYMQGYYFDPPLNYRPWIRDDLTV